jgi:5-methyltetrahydropteroyltriglutamate--homocysteine methyltransferase
MPQTSGPGKTVYNEVGLWWDEVQGQIHLTAQNVDGFHTTVSGDPDSKRIVRYAQVVGRENVIAGTDCGLGGRVHPQIAWAKLEALAKGAELASKELWS